MILGCEDPGVTRNHPITGINAENLPDELKGLKVYSVCLGDGEWIQVATLNGQINSGTYPKGKVQETTVVINPNCTSERVIYAQEIISETEDIIVIRK